VIIDLHGGGDVFSLRSGFSQAHGNHLADMTHLALGQYGLCRRTKPRQGGVGDNGFDSRAIQVVYGEYLILISLRRVNGIEPGMCDRAANECDILHSGHAYVRDILSPAPHVAIVLLAKNPFAHTLLRHYKPPEGAFPPNLVVRKPR